MSYPLTARRSRLLGAGVAFQSPTIMIPSLRGQVPPRLTSPIPPKPVSAIRPAPGTVQFPTGISEPIPFPPPGVAQFLRPKPTTGGGGGITPKVPVSLGPTDQGGSGMLPGPGGVPILTGPISGPDSGGGGGGGGGGIVSAGPDGVAVAGQAEIPWGPILIAAALGALYLASRGN